MFCDFLARSSGGGANPSGLPRGLPAGSPSPNDSMLRLLSSRASCRARWSSTKPHPPPPRSPNRLDGISTCDAILSVAERGSPLVSLGRIVFVPRGDVRFVGRAAVDWRRRRRVPAGQPARARVLGRAAAGARGDCSGDATRHSFRPPALQCCSRFLLCFSHFGR